MSGKAARVCIIAGACLVAACEPPTDPIPAAESLLLVQGVLDVGGLQQYVTVERISRGSGGFEGFVRGATVTITSPRGSMYILDEDSLLVNENSLGEGGRDLLRVYVARGLQGTALIQGDTYTLHVRTPSGEEVRGTTTIPLKPGLRAVETQASFERERDTLRLDWPRASQARSYQVSVRNSLVVQGGGFVLSDLYTVFSDTTIVIPGTARTLENDPVFRKGWHATVLVAAADDNYYTYYRSNTDPFAGAPPSRLTGAVGVFGSIVPVVIHGLEVR